MNRRVCKCASVCVCTSVRVSAGSCVPGEQAECRRRAPKAAGVFSFWKQMYNQHNSPEEKAEREKKKPRPVPIPLT